MPPLRILSKRQLRIALELIMVVVLALAGTLVTASSSRAATDQYFTVSSQMGWQQTPFIVQDNHMYLLEQVGGSWTVDYRSLPYVDGYGYGVDQDSKIWKGCKYIDYPNALTLQGFRAGFVPYGLLLGKVIPPGGSIANSPTYALGASNRAFWGTGRIWLRINDQDRCLVDNRGSLRMHFVLS